MARIGVQEINASSMADIAFLLLIFFLVTTTMDVDTGIARQLPPIPENKDVITQVKILDRNLLRVMINSRDRLSVNGRQMSVEELKEKAKEFIKSAPNREDLPELEEMTIKGINKPVMVSKGIISLQNDRGTTYGRYIEVQDRLVAAYNELRDEAAWEYFGKRKFDDLTEAQQEAVKEIYPQRISEAEPKNLAESRNMGGNR